MGDDKIRISWQDIESTAVDQPDPRRENTPVLPPQPPLQSPLQPKTPPTRRTVSPQVVLLMAGGGLFLALMSVAGVLIAMATAFSPSDANAPPDEAEQNRIASVQQIESVLRQDARANTGAQSVAEVVGRMRFIDLSGCPTEFKSAYLAHIHAWESMAVVEQQLTELAAHAGSADAMVESLLRGFLGDPFGKANETIAAGNRLQQEYQTARKQVRSTFQRVEQIAVAHGANVARKE